MKLGFFSDVVVELEGPARRPGAGLPGDRAAHRPRGHHRRQRRALQGRPQGHRRGEALLDARPGRGPQGREEDPGEVRREGLLPGRGDLEARAASPTTRSPSATLVDEKAKVQVKEIRFLGNQALSTDQTLTGVMQTQEGGLLSFLNRTRHLPRGRLPARPAAIQAAYLDQGYVNVKVGKPSVALSPDQRFLFITIPVEEGEQYTIGKIDFSGELLGEEPRLRRAAASPGRRAASPARSIGQDLFAVSDVYKDLGYAYANVTPLTTIDAAEAHRRPRPSRSSPASKVRFERIEIVGQREDPRQGDAPRAAHLRGRAVQRHRPCAPPSSGSPRSASSRRSRSPPRRAAPRTLIVATVEVKEKATGTFQLGAGFSSYENFILTGQISQQNFFGWGQTLSPAAPVVVDPPARADPVRRAVLPRHPLDLRLRPLRDRELLHHASPAGRSAAT